MRIHRSVAPDKARLHADVLLVVVVLHIADGVALVNPGIPHNAVRNDALTVIEHLNGE